MLKEKRPHGLKGVDGQPITRLEAKKFIREHLRVPEEVRKLRRQHHQPTKKSIKKEMLNAMEGWWGDATTNEAATAPQRGDAIPLCPKDEYNAGRRVRQLVSSAP